MIGAWAYLEPNSRETFRTIVAFLGKRLAEQGTIDWALKLRPGQRIERIAVEELLSGLGNHTIAEPWASAWRLIEESWSTGRSEELDGAASYSVQLRLRAGDRSGSTISAIVDLVAPRLKVAAIEAWRWKYVQRPRKPKTVDHILYASLTSGDLIDLDMLELSHLDDVAFLTSLANALEAAVNHGLDIARRLGWDGRGQLWQLGDLGRVYYVNDAPRAGEDLDPDTYRHGIAPSVKLLHAVVTRLSELDLGVGQSIARRWMSNGSPIYLRLWAAMSRKEQFTPINEITDFFTMLDQDRFFDVHGFPELAELRAIRYREMNRQAQKAIVARIRKGPPRDHWLRKATHAEILNARLYWSSRELRRIEVGGGTLPDRAKTWLDVQSVQFADLAQMTIDEGFPGGFTVTVRGTKPEAMFDTLSGIERLRALEAALGTGRRGWDDDPAERANAWVNQQGNTGKILADFETTNHGGDDFPKVWNRFGWAHRPPSQGGQPGQDEQLGDEAGRVLRLLHQLSDTTRSNAIEGICAWLDAWKNYAVELPLVLPIWLCLWPHAVKATNLKAERTDEAALSVVARVDRDEGGSMDLDTLNTPAGKLVGVFLAACPSLPPGAQSFPAGSMERQMRDIVIAAKGRSGLIAKHRMIEALSYFLRADPDWAREYLIAPLLKDDDAALALWRAVARHTHFTNALEAIGAAMADRANDRRLGRDTRRQLVFSLVVESLHAFREGRDPAVPNPRIQQMLRTLDDEVRASAANTIQKFVLQLSAKAVTNAAEGGQEPAAAAALFRTAAAPFLREVWPQERSLATPGVSGALADLPAASGEAFPEAVEAIARFLVPFDCWSISSYGLQGNEGEAKKLCIVNDQAKAQALLKLLDLTIGTSESARFPHDLTDALDQISVIAPDLINAAAFRRLSALGRR